MTLLLYPMSSERRCLCFFRIVIRTDIFRFSKIVGRMKYAGPSTPRYAVNRWLTCSCDIVNVATWSIHDICCGTGRKPADWIYCAPETRNLANQLRSSSTTLQSFVRTLAELHTKRISMRCMYVQNATFWKNAYVRVRTYTQHPPRFVGRTTWTLESSRCCGGKSVLLAQ